MTQILMAGPIIGESAAIRNVRAQIERIARHRLPVLIHGPTGAGKELVAEALHVASGRPGPFVAFNVCAISEAMFEDALFGHVKGAFTGATSNSPGYLLEANNGTIFLDEISGLALPAQVKLLRAIETGVFRAVGATSDRASNFRVVAATNEPLATLLAQGRFRPDLAHRLSGFSIELPALKDRLEDIPLLVNAFLEQLAPVYGAISISEAGVRALQANTWPGNIRELRHVLERAIALATRPVLGRNEMAAALQQGRTEPRINSRESFARRRLIEVLDAANWDTAQAAERLGVHRVTIYRRMRRLGISGPESSAVLMQHAE